MPDSPSRRSVTLAGSTTPVVADALVVTLRDGTLGFTTSDADALADARVVLTDPASGRTTTGSTRVARSGAAYEEVRGRTRAASGPVTRLLARWQDRRVGAVVLVVPDATTRLD